MQAIESMAFWCSMIVAISIITLVWVLFGDQNKEE